MQTTIKKSLISIFSLAVLSILSSCKKEGFGGDATISGHITCDCNLSDTKVYINFGGKDDNFPNSDNYSESDYYLKSDAYGAFQLDDLVQGGYYFYAQYTNEDGILYEGKEFVNVKEGLSNNFTINLYEK